MNASRRRGLREHAFAALLFTLLALLFVAPGLLPGKVLSNDDSLWFYPPWDSSRPAELLRAANPEVDDGPAFLRPLADFLERSDAIAPAWNPTVHGGRPFLANSQSAPLSAFNIPVRLLGYDDALAWVFALKIFLAAFGMYLLARRLGQRLPGGLLAGVVYGLNLWLVTWLVYPHASVWALLPWLLVAVDAVVRRADALSASGLAAATALVLLSGHPESAVHALLAASAFLALRILQEHRRPEGPARPWWLTAGVAVIGLALGAAVAAVTILPALELLRRSADVQQRANSAVDAALPGRYLLGILMPDYWGQATGTALEPFLLARACYVGALPLMLAVVALVVRPRGRRLVAASIGVAALGIAFGLPVLLQVVTRLPLFSSGHNARLIVLFTLCAALLAGWGLDDVLAGRLTGRRRTVALWALGATAFVPVLVVLSSHVDTAAVLRRAIDIAWAFGSPPPRDSPSAVPTIHSAAAVVWAGMGALALGFLALASARRRRVGLVAFAATGLLLATADLFRAGMGYYPAIDRAAATQPATPAIDVLRRSPESRFVSVGRIPQNVISMKYGLREARGYDLPIDSRYDRYWRTRISPEFPTQVGKYLDAIPLSVPKLDAGRLRALSQLSVSRVLQAPDDPPLRIPGLRLVYAGSDARVYENERAMPRVVLAGSQEVARTSEAQLAAVSRPDFDPRSTAVVARPLAGIPVAGTPGADRPAGSARVISEGDDEVRIAASPTRRSILVLTDTAYPGWQASVNGRPATVLRVNDIHRGVVVGPGDTRVTLRFRPTSVRLGWALSVGGLLTLLALAVGGVLLRRRAPHAAAADSLVSPPPESHEQPTGLRSRLAAISPFGRRLALIVLAAAALRLLFVLTIARGTSGLGDFQFYNWTADLIADRKGFINPFIFAFTGQEVETALHPPLWSYALSIVSGLGGTGSEVGTLLPSELLPHRLLGVVLGPLLVLCLGLLGRRAAGPRAGLVAAGVGAVYPGFVAMDGSIMSEVLYGPLFAATLLAAYALIRRPDWPRALALGLLIGTCALTRGEALLLLGFLVVPVVIAARVQARRAIGLATLALVGAALLVAPWTMRNLSAFGEPVLIPTNAGALWGGANCPPAFSGPDVGYWRRDCLRTTSGRNEAQQAAQWRRDGFTYASNHVDRLPVVMGIRILRTWNLWHPIRQAELMEGQPRRMAVVAGFAGWLLAGLGVVGAIVLHRRRETLAVLVPPLVMVTVVAAIGVGAPRYRYAADIALVVLAAVGIDAILRRRDGRRTSAAADMPAAPPSDTDPAVADLARRTPE